MGAQSVTESTSDEKVTGKKVKDEGGATIQIKRGREGKLGKREVVKVKGMAGQRQGRATQPQNGLTPIIIITNSLVGIARE